jgi:hypothetical protein
MEPRGGLTIVPEVENRVEHVPVVSTLAYRAARDHYGVRAVAAWARGIEIRIGNVGIQPGDAEHQGLRKALSGYAGVIGFYPSPAERTRADTQVRPYACLLAPTTIRARGDDEAT